MTRQLSTSRELTSWKPSPREAPVTMAVGMARTLCPGGARSVSGIGPRADDRFHDPRTRLTTSRGAGSPPDPGDALRACHVCPPARAAGTVPVVRAAPGIRDPRPSGHDGRGINHLGEPSAARRTVVASDGSAALAVRPRLRRRAGAGDPAGPGERRLRARELPRARGAVPVRRGDRVRRGRGAHPAVADRALL